MASVPDLTGDPYIKVLKRFHEELQPQSYLEVGTLFGDSLAFVECPSVAIDPKFQLKTSPIGRRSFAPFIRWRVTGSSSNTIQKPFSDDQSIWRFWMVCTGQNISFGILQIQSSTAGRTPLYFYMIACQSKR